MKTYEELMRDAVGFQDIKCKKCGKWCKEIPMSKIIENNNEWVCCCCKERENENKTNRNTNN